MHTTVDFTFLEKMEELALLAKGQRVFECLDEIISQLCGGIDSQEEGSDNGESEEEPGYDLAIGGGLKFATEEEE
jgi:hypothetical protein